MTAIGNWIAEAVTAQIEREANATEEAIETALQGGTCGVLLIRSDNSIKVGPHLAVPYGHLYEVPEAGYAPFLARWVEAAE